MMDYTYKNSDKQNNLKLEGKQLLAAKLLGVLPALHSLPPKIFRPMFLIMDRLFGIKKEVVNRIVNHSVPVSTVNSSNTSIAIRAYYPHIESNVPSETTCKKTLVYFHGGGCVVGSIATHDRLCRYLAVHGNMNIISVDYRLSPEYKFPTPVCDAIDAWNWIHVNHKQLNIDPNHIGAGGDSAGGYLASIIGLTSEQSSLPIKSISHPKFQFLLFPMLDLQGLTESYRNFNKHLILTRNLMDYFRDHFLVSPEQASQSLVSPLLSNHLSESPNSYILTLGHDPLRDDGITYANRLKEKGIKIHHEHYGDCMHSFTSVTRWSARARQATHDIASALDRFNH